MWGAGAKPQGLSFYLGLSKNFILNCVNMVCKGSREEIPCGASGQSPKVLAFAYVSPKPIRFLKKVEQKLLY